MSPITIKTLKAIKDLKTNLKMNLKGLTLVLKMAQLGSRSHKGSWKLNETKKVSMWLTIHSLTHSLKSVKILKTRKTITTQLTLNSLKSLESQLIPKDLKTPVVQTLMTIKNISRLSRLLRLQFSEICRLSRLLTLSRPSIDPQYYQDSSSQNYQYSRGY